MLKSTKTYPSRVLVDELFKRDIPCSLMWEIPGPKDTQIAFLSAYLIRARVVIVQTWKDGNGWEVYMPAKENMIQATVEEVIAHCTLPDISPSEKLGFPK